MTEILKKEEDKVLFCWTVIVDDNASGKQADDPFFEMLYWKYSKEIYQYIDSFCEDKSAVNDIFQETWITVLKNVEKLKKRDEDRIEDFIFSTAHKRMKHSLLERGKERRRMIYNPDENIEDTTDFFAQCESDGIKTVCECINMLSDDQREVMRLYYLKEYSLKEIANHLKISESAANSRWCRGRKNLIQLLKERRLR